MPAGGEFAGDGLDRVERAVGGDGEVGVVVGDHDGIAAWCPTLEVPLRTSGHNSPTAMSTNRINQPKILRTLHLPFDLTCCRPTSPYVQAGRSAHERAADRGGR